MIPTPWPSALPRLGIILALLFICLWWFQLWHSGSCPASTPQKAKRPPLPFTPRTPADCPDCVRSPAVTNVPAVTITAVRPWCEGKSSRGRPKQIETEGYACEFKDCQYRGITDARIHALVGDGHHGKAHSIQDFRCEACDHKFSARRHTVLYRLKTQAKHVAEVLASLAEGTITTWLTRAGMHSERFHVQKMQGLHLGHVQLDELWTTLRNKGHEVWLWLALDARTKLIAAAKLEPRTQAMAHALIHSLVQILALGCIPLFTSDGLNLYFNRLTAHFGTWVENVSTKKREWHGAASLVYGQLIKSYRRRKLARVERVMRWDSLDALKSKLLDLGWSGILQTAFVERVNLTVRRGLAMLARRSWSTPPTLAPLKDGFAWWRANYHIVKPHEALRVELGVPRERGGKRIAQRYRARTPAMAAGITDHRWTVVELLAYPVPA